MKVTAKNKTHASLSFTKEEIASNPKLRKLLAQYGGFHGDPNSFDEPGVEEAYDDSHLGADGQPDLAGAELGNMPGGQADDDGLAGNSGDGLGGGLGGDDGDMDSSAVDGNELGGHGETGGSPISEIEAIFGKHGKQLPPELHEQLEQALNDNSELPPDDLGNENGMGGDMGGGLGGDTSGGSIPPDITSRTVSRGRLTKVGNQTDFVNNIAELMAKSLKESR